MRIVRLLDVQITGVATFGGLHRRFRLTVGRLDIGAAGQASIELVGEIGRHLVVDRPGRGDHGRDVGIQEALGLLLGGAAVQHHQLQALLLGEKRRQPARVGGRRLTRRRLQQQLIAVGVTGVVQDRDAVAVSRILEHLEDVVGGAVAAYDDLAQALLCRRVQDFA